MIDLIVAKGPLLESVPALLGASVWIADPFGKAQPSIFLRHQRRLALMQLEQMIDAQPHVDVPPEHLFAAGLYMRTITLPAGCAMSGGIHRFEHMCVVSAGEVVIVSEEGRHRFKAPCQLVGRPGIKRVGFAVSDVTWSTIHPCDVGQMDPEKLWKFLIADSYEDFDSLGIDRGGF